MMRRTSVTLGLVAALVLIGTSAFAWGPGFGRGMGYGPAGAAASLGADQVAKIQKIQSERFPEIAKLRAEMFAKRAELQVLFREPTLDPAKIAAKGKEIEALRAQMSEKALAVRTAVAEVLTPEQRAQLPALGPGMGPGFGPGHGFGPGMGMGRMGMGFGPH